MPSDTILEKNIGELFGFEGSSDEEKGELLNDVGVVILESAALRFLAELDEKETARFEALLQETADDENSLMRVSAEFSRFAEILEEETAAFKQEAVAVLA